ncbi:TetR/AcrR family transcriptional regulator [Streptosporangium sp. NPDC002721]|uniref:TetR/AcrR family transcriptional regulator n=1 Tax=Streptosporangium sp. NPDC002721 TaxID=3366188 RepID=UPI003682667D
MTTPLRKDAARNWERIVAVARELIDDGTPLQLNDVAHHAGLGVGTVYRHFPTAEALMETLASACLAELAAHGEQALADDDPWRALTGFLSRTVQAQLTDASLAPVMAAPADTLPRTTELKAAVWSAGERLLARAHHVGAVRADVTSDDMVPLMCGIAYAATVHGSSPTTRVRAAHHYLTVLLEGLHV